MPVNFGAVASVEYEYDEEAASALDLSSAAPRATLLLTPAGGPGAADSDVVGISLAFESQRGQQAPSDEADEEEESEEEEQEEDVVVEKLEEDAGDAEGDEATKKATAKKATAKKGGKGIIRKKSVIKSEVVQKELLEQLGIEEVPIDGEELEQVPEVPEVDQNVSVLGRETNEERAYRKKLEARAKRDREYEERRRQREEEEDAEEEEEDVEVDNNSSAQSPAPEEGTRWRSGDDDDDAFSEAHVEDTLRRMEQLKQQCLACQKPMEFWAAGAESGATDAYLRQLLGPKEMQLQEDEVKIRVFLRWEEEKERQKHQGKMAMARFAKIRSVARNLRPVDPKNKAQDNPGGEDVEAEPPSPVGGEGQAKKSGKSEKSHKGKKEPARPSEARAPKRKGRL